MPILSVKRIKCPTSQVLFQAFGPFSWSPLPVSLMFAPSPALLGPLMLESHKLEFVFCQVELFSCRQNLEGFSKRSEFNSRCVRHVWPHLCSTHLLLSLDLWLWHAIGRVWKGTLCFGFGLLHVKLTCLRTWIELFCAALWRGRNFQSKECFATQAVLNIQPQSVLEKDASYRQWK